MNDADPWGKAGIWLSPQQPHMMPALREGLLLSSFLSQSTNGTCHFFFFLRDYFWSNFLYNLMDLFLCFTCQLFRNFRCMTSAIFYSDISCTCPRWAGGLRFHFFVEFFFLSLWSLDYYLVFLSNLSWLSILFLRILLCGWCSLSCRAPQYRGGTGSLNYSCGTNWMSPGFFLGQLAENYWCEPTMIILLLWLHTLLGCQTHLFMMCIPAMALLCHWVLVIPVRFLRVG